MDSLSRAVELLRPARLILVFTGAGISTESGIPDFRGPNGLWTKVDPDDFTIGRYRTNPELRKRGWQMHLEGKLWGARSKVRPNPAHYAVVDLWKAGRLAGCVTQNVDGLQQVAGLPDNRVAELHGNVRKVRCLDCRRLWPIEEVLNWVEAGADDPRCPDCGGIVKTTTVMFGEFLPTDQVRLAAGFAAMADAVVVVGSTISVYPAADVALSVVRRGKPMVIINLGPTDHDHLAGAIVEAKAGEALPRLVAGLSSQELFGSS